jgi:DNA helicase-2/ATP-dependent DNA helicase PcrA
MPDTPGLFVPSPEQREIISHRGGHLQVIACAGSGKTESIARRIASLIADDQVEPSSIIAFTFTERAAAALKDRVGKRVAEAKGREFLDRLGPMFVGTIHSYCLRMLQDHVPEYGGFDVLDEHRRAGLLSREYRELGLDKLGDKHWEPIRDFIRQVEVIECEVLNAADLPVPIGPCYQAYLQMLARYRLFSFGRIIGRAVEVLEGPEVFADVHGPLRHLIVDEYQDINPAQERLIELLSRPPVHLCVVGDDDQSIYAWRGSQVENILTFRDRYPKVRTIPLDRNRRSRPKIIETAGRFAETIQPRLPKTMTLHRPAAGPEVVLWSAATDVDEAERVAQAIQDLHARGFRYRDIAVLFRSVRTSAPPLVRVLRDRGIPFRCAGRTGLFLQPEIQTLARTYAWISDREWGISNWSGSEPVDLGELVDSYHQAFPGAASFRGLKAYLEAWKAATSGKDRPVNLVGDYYRLLYHLGVAEMNPDVPADLTRLGSLARFSQALADYESVTRRGRHVEEEGQQVYRGGMDRGVRYYERLHSYLMHYARDAYEDFDGEGDFDTEAVDIATVHQAKGLEWPVVFVPALTDRRFPSSMTGRSQTWLLPDSLFPPSTRIRYEGSETEERRLFYVALTRAREVLYLSSFERMTKRTPPSRFLRDLSIEDAPVGDKLPMPPAPDERGGADEGITVTFSDLAQYEECPHGYRLRTLLGFQPQIVRELGYGRAIHQVLHQVAELAMRTGGVPTEAEADRILEEAFYLPYANRPAFEEMHDSARRMVRAYLTDYPDDLERIWMTERPFELHVEGGVVSGRADVILDREEGVQGRLAIVDYKTAGDVRDDASYSFQLAIYTAAGRGEGLDVRAAYLHQLKSGVREDVPVDPGSVASATERASGLIRGLRSRSFPPKPEPGLCRRCDARALCGHAACSKVDRLGD